GCVGLVPTRPFPPAIEPSAPTGMPWLVKNALPRLFVVDGPANETWMYTGRSRTAASSSARDGRRFSPNWLGLKPPIVVIHWPTGTTDRRAAIVCCTSAIEYALSSGVW